MIPGDPLPDPVGGARAYLGNRPGCLGQVGVALALAVGLLGVGLGAALGYLAHSPQPPPAASVRTERTGASVLTAVRELARLEGAEFHIERVVELTETQRRVFGLVEADDAILLVASGRVVAGVDLSELAADDISLDPDRRSARLRLPPVRVLHARLDNERTYVHSRETDALARRVETLESDARRAAERTMAQAARDGNIVAVAEASVKRTVSGLVRALGYEDVTVTFRKDPSSGPASSAPNGE